MTIISNQITASTSNVTNRTSSASSTADASTAAAFAQAIATATAATPAPTTASVSLLTDAATALAARPDMKQFMDATGANAADASELLYGTVGSNTDTRNWQAIMSSTDPVTMARQATAAMYNGGNNVVNAANSINTEGNGLVAQSGNFALQQVTVATTATGTPINHTSLDVIDSRGNILRDAGTTPEQIQRNAWLFGIDTAPLQQLVQPAAQLSQSLSSAISQATASSTTPTAVQNLMASHSSVTSSTTSLAASLAAVVGSSTPSTTIVASSSSTPTTEAPTATAQTTPTEASTQAQISTLSQQMANLSNQLATGGTTAMSQFMASYNQLQALMAQMNTLQTTSQVTS